MKMPETRTALYVTCLINTLRPSVAHACVNLLQQAGVPFDVPEDQTCCGQPAYNSGHRQQAQAVAQQQIRVLEPYEQIVVPSGSCAGMLRIHYPDLFERSSHWHERALKLASKVFELSEFLTKAGWSPPLQSHTDSLSCAHHTSCSCLRETRSHQLADHLLRQAGAHLHAVDELDTCCGFGGTFSVKYDDISHRMGCQKLDNLERSGAKQVVSADLGCLLHLEGLANKQQRRLRFFHLAEVLAPGNQN